MRFIACTGEVICLLTTKFAAYYIGAHSVSQFEMFVFYDCSVRFMRTFESFVLQNGNRPTNLILFGTYIYRQVLTKPKFKKSPTKI